MKISGARDERGYCKSCMFADEREWLSTVLSLHPANWHCSFKLKKEVLITLVELAKENDTDIDI